MPLGSSVCTMRSAVSSSSGFDAVGSIAAELFEGLAQEAIVIERIDDQVRERVVALAAGRAAEAARAANRAAWRAKRSIPSSRACPHRRRCCPMPLLEVKSSSRSVRSALSRVCSSFGARRLRGFHVLLEEGILRDGLVQFLHTLERRQLQQLHGLLQSRRQGELLLQAQPHYGVGHVGETLLT